MIGPLLSPPSCNRRNGTAFCALWRPFVAARSRSPSIQKCSELRPPEHLGTANIQPFRQFPPRLPLSFFPLGFLRNCALFATLAMLMRAFVHFRGQRWGNRPAFLWIAERFGVLRFRLMVKRGPCMRPQASEGEAQHGLFCWTRRVGQGDERLHCG